MINKVILEGRLTREPELRNTQAGKSVLSYTLACNRRVQVPGQPDADFVSCITWGKAAEAMANYLHKGSLISVAGRIQTRSYDNQQGQKVYVTEVVTEEINFLESKNSQPSNNSYQNNQTQSNPYQSNLDVNNQDLPF